MAPVGGCAGEDEEARRVCSGGRLTDEEAPLESVQQTLSTG